MKQKQRLHLKSSFGVLAIALCLFSAATSQAVTYYWDPGLTGPGTGTASGGTVGGAWDAATTSDWYDGVSADILWPSGADAEFDTIGGNVTVGTGGVTVNNMTFNNTAGNYLVTTGTANSITLTGKVTVNGNQVNFGSGTSNPAIIAGSAGLVKDGTGILNIDARAAASTYTGGTTIMNGTLAINREQALGATPAATDYNNIVMKTGAQFNYGLTTSPSALRGIRLDGNATFDETVTGTLSWPGPVTGSGGLNIIATGTVRFTTNALTYSGDTVIQSGTLSQSVLDSYPYKSNPNNGIAGTTGTGAGNMYIWSAGILYMNNLDAQINGLNDGTATGHGAGTVQQAGSNSHTLTLGDNNANGSFSGTLTGAIWP